MNFGLQFLPLLFRWNRGTSQNQKGEIQVEKMCAVILQIPLTCMKWLSVGAEMMLEMLISSALSPELDLVGHKPELPNFSKLIFCQMPPLWSVSAQTSSDLIYTSTHRISALIINDIHESCDWDGKLWIGHSLQSNLILIFLSLQGVEGNAKAKAKSGRKS